MSRTRDAMARLTRSNPVDQAHIPAPGASREERIERAIARGRSGGPVPAPRRRRRRLVLSLAIAGAVAAGGAATAAIQWGPDDIPAQGDGQYAFSAKVVEQLPEGFRRVRPALIDELPERPSLRFAPGVTYSEAIGSYLAARGRGEVVPAGAAIEPPLPRGISVAVARDGSVAIDPAAPLGWDPRRGLVAPAFQPPVRSVTLPRCQVLLPDDAPAPARCDPATRLYATEAGGAWSIARAGGPSVDPPRLVGSTDLSILTRPAVAADRVPAELRVHFERDRGRFGGRPYRLDFDAARAVEYRGVAIRVIPSTDGDYVCLTSSAAAGGMATSCNPRTVLITFGALPLITAGRYTALVGDGYERVTVPGAGSYPIIDNVFSVPLPSGLDAITLEGPLGRHRISTFGR